LWRRILIATGLVVALAATAAWLALPTQYEAFALLKVSGRQPSILERGTATPDEFMLFKATQRQLVAGNLVATGVLRDATIHSLATVQSHQNDPVAWLTDALRVDFPGDAEIMRVSLKTNRPGDSQTIVDKVVQVYLAEIVERDKQLKQANEHKLQAAYERQGVEYEAALKQLSDLEKTFKTSGSEAAQLKKRLTLESLNVELATRRRLIERLEETELEAVLNEARAALPTETRTADPDPATTPATTDSAAALPAALLTKKREFFEQKLAEAEERIAKLTDEVASLETFSAQVTSKQEDLESLRAIKNELGSKVDRIKLERLAAERITEIQKAELTSTRGDRLRRNVLLGTLAASGLALMGLGLAIGRSKSSTGGAPSEQLSNRSV
jgi:NADH dehydrogenase/NADH:ubiquinone oxidoreductase subunit G